MLNTTHRRRLRPRSGAGVARKGRWQGMVAYLGTVWGCRYFWLSLVRMDLRTRYRGSALGLGWSLLQPIAMTAILCSVFSTIFKADVRVYAPFLMSGLTFWNFVVTTSI